MNFNDILDPLKRSSINLEEILCPSYQHVFPGLTERDIVRSVDLLFVLGTALRRASGSFRILCGVGLLTASLACILSGKDKNIYKEWG